MTNNQLVREFMQTFGQEVKQEPAFPTEEVMALRLALIEEEVQELREAIEANDLLEVVDALTDILYVVYGAGHTIGVDLDATFEEVHNSNMSKLDENGNPIYREDGKIMKGPNYFRPDLTKFI